jgi:hypothetical protein
VPRQKEHDRQRDDGDEGRQRPTDLQAAESHGITAREVGLGEQQEEAEQQKHHHGIEHPLENNRCKGGRGTEALLAGEQPWAQHLASAGRQYGAGGKSNDGHPQGVREAHATDRREQVLPSHRAKHVRQRGQRHRDEHEIHPGARDLRPHVAQVGVAQEERQQDHSQQRNGHSSQVCTHERGGGSGYYMPLSGPREAF